MDNQKRFACVLFKIVRCTSIETDILSKLAKRYAATIRFINTLDLLELTKQAYKGTEAEDLQAMYQAAVLVIDDDKRILRICRKKNIKSTIKYANNGCTRQAANAAYRLY